MWNSGKITKAAVRHNKILMQNSKRVVAANKSRVFSVSNVVLLLESHPLQKHDSVTQLPLSRPSSSVFSPSSTCDVHVHLISVPSTALFIDPSHTSYTRRNVTWTTWPITRTIHRVSQSGRSICITWRGEFTCEKWHVTAAGTDRHAVLSFTLLSSGRFPPVFRSCGGVCGKFPRVTNSEFGAELMSAVDLTEPMDRLN